MFSKKVGRWKSEHDSEYGRFDEKISLEQSTFPSAVGIQADEEGRP